MYPQSSFLETPVQRRVVETIKEGARMYVSDDTNPLNHLNEFMELERDHVRGNQYVILSYTSTENEKKNVCKVSVRVDAKGQCETIYSIENKVFMDRVIKRRYGYFHIDLLHLINSPPF